MLRGRPSLLRLLDNDPRFPVDETGSNKVGYLSRDGMVYFENGRGVAIRSLWSIRARIRAEIEMLGEINFAVIDAFFASNRMTPISFQVGLKALVRSDFEFFENPIRWPIFAAISENERCARWSFLARSAMPGDLIFLSDRGSVTSRLMAALDGGVWSHMAICCGGGRFLDARPGGVAEHNMEEWAESHYRLALYRPRMRPEKIQALMTFHRDQIGCGYNYFGVLLTWVRKLFGDVERIPTPNDFAMFMRQVDLIALV